MLLRSISLVSAAFLLCASVVAAQPLISSVSVAGGVSERLHANLDKDDLIPFVETELETGQLDLPSTGISISGGVHLGYWGEDAAPLRSCADCIVYSYKAATFGVRVLLNLDTASLPLSLVLGYTRQEVFATYSGGTGIDGKIGKDYSFDVNLAEIGARILFPVSARLRVGVEGLSLQKLRTESNEPYRQQWRLAFRTAYSLN